MLQPQNMQPLLSRSSSRAATVCDAGINMEISEDMRSSACTEGMFNSDPAHEATASSCSVAACLQKAPRPTALTTTCLLKAGMPGNERQASQHRQRIPMKTRFIAQVNANRGRLPFVTHTFTHSKALSRSKTIFASRTRLTCSCTYPGPDTRKKRNCREACCRCSGD